MWQRMTNVVIEKNAQCCGFRESPLSIKYLSGKKSEAIQRILSFLWMLPFWYGWLDRFVFSNQKHFNSKFNQNLHNSQEENDCLLPVSKLYSNCSPQTNSTAPASTRKQSLSPSLSIHLSFPSSVPSSPPTPYTIKLPSTNVKGHCL